MGDDLEQYIKWWRVHKGVKDVAKMKLLRWKDTHWTVTQEEVRQLAEVAVKALDEFAAEDRAEQKRKQDAIIAKRQSWEECQRELDALFASKTPIVEDFPPGTRVSYTLAENKYYGTVTSGAGKVSLRDYVWAYWDQLVGNAKLDCVHKLKLQKEVPS